MNQNNPINPNEEPAGRPSFLDELLESSQGQQKLTQDGQSPSEQSSVTQIQPGNQGFSAQSSNEGQYPQKSSVEPAHDIVTVGPIDSPVNTNSSESFFSFISPDMTSKVSGSTSEIDSSTSQIKSTTETQFIPSVATQTTTQTTTQTIVSSGVPQVSSQPDTQPVPQIVPQAAIPSISQGTTIPHTATQPNIQVTTPQSISQTTTPQSVPQAAPQAVSQPVPSIPQDAASPQLTEILPGITATTAPVGASSVQAIKKPVTTGQILRIIGALFFVALIFFGSFLAYIVFNPEQAKFFISFGINPADIANLLVKLVNGIFGSLTVGLSALFMYFLFRFYLAKGAPKKRAVYAILSAFSGIVLFSNIGFWAYLFQVIGASDFVRPSGGIIVYDNDLLLSEQFKKQAELTPDTLTSLVGPVSIRYDLSSDARYASKEIEIESFEIDCNGDGSIEHEGVSPNDESIICSYDKRGSFQPRGTYIGRDTVTRDPVKRKMEFPTVKVVGIVDIKTTDNSIVFDATDLKSFGKLSWYTGSDFQTKASSDFKYSTKISDAEQFVCLAMTLSNSKEDVCRKVFSVASKSDSPIVGVIKYETDPDNPMKYLFRVIDARSKSGGEIESYTWYLNDTDRFGKGETVEKLFITYGTYKVSVEMLDTAKNKVVLTEKLTIQKPLQLTKGSNMGSQLVVQDLEGNSMIENAYDRSIQAYRITGLSVPTKMVFDATDVRVENTGFVLKDVEWKFNSDIKKGMRVEYEFIGEKRYEIDVTYIFGRTGAKEEEASVKEKIIIEGKSPEISPVMDITPDGAGDIDNMFAPATVKFDASASKVKSGTISQFIYDFGEGKESSEGEAIKTYLYTIPGEYTVTLTVVKDDGTKSKISRKLIIKNAPRKLSLSASVSSGIVNRPVEFSTSGSVGQISSYEWSFGDGEKSEEANPNHTYTTAGKYTVTLNARYDDGVIRTEKLEFEVSEE